MLPLSAAAERATAVSAAVCASASRCQARRQQGNTTWHCLQAGSNPACLPCPPTLPSRCIACRGHRLHQQEWLCWRLWRPRHRASHHHHPRWRVRCVLACWHRTPAGAVGCPLASRFRPACGPCMLDAFVYALFCFAGSLLALSVPLGFVSVLCSLHSELFPVCGPQPRRHRHAAAGGRRDPRRHHRRVQCRWHG